MSGVNVELYAATMDALVEAGVPGLLMGDHNMRPAEVAERVAGSRLRLEVRAPAEPTYVSGVSSAILDYAIVHPVLGTLLEPMQVEPEFGFSPHIVVAAMLRLPGPKDMVRVWRKPGYGAANLVFGPIVPGDPQSCELRRELERFAQRVGGLDRAREPTDRERSEAGLLYRPWARLVESEFAPNCGMLGLPGGPLRFVQVPFKELMELRRACSAASKDLRQMRRVAGFRASFGAEPVVAALRRCRVVLRFFVLPFGVVGSASREPRGMWLKPPGRHWSTSCESHPRMPPTKRSRARLWPSPTPLSMRRSGGRAHSGGSVGRSGSRRPSRRAEARPTALSSRWRLSRRLGREWMPVMVSRLMLRSGRAFGGLPPPTPGGRAA